MIIKIPSFLFHKKVIIKLKQKMKLSPMYLVIKNELAYPICLTREKFENRSICIVKKKDDLNDFMHNKRKSFENMIM